MKFPELPNWFGWMAVLFALAVVWKILSLDIDEIDIKDFVTVRSGHKLQSLSDIHAVVASIFS